MACLFLQALHQTVAQQEQSGKQHHAVGKKAESLPLQPFLEPVSQQNTYGRRNQADEHQTQIDSCIQSLPCKQNQHVGIENQPDQGQRAPLLLLVAQMGHLTKYFGDLHVLDDVSFNIRKGEFLCVVGPTGCGKTTFLNLLTRIYMPTRGELYIDGEPADPKKHNLAVVFQEPSSMPWLTVEQNLRFGLEIKKLPKDEIERRVENMIQLLGLEEFRKCYPHQLSVSTAQRIIIGRAFAMQPDLLLMDEPYGQMDIKLRFYLEDEVIRLWKETGTTVVFITHNIEEAVYLAERVLILTNKPAKIKEEVLVDLPRPRKVSDPEFIKIRNHITEQIKWW